MQIRGSQTDSLLLLIARFSAQICWLFAPAIAVVLGVIERVNECAARKTRGQGNVTADVNELLLMKLLKSPEISKENKWLQSRQEYLNADLCFFVLELPHYLCTCEVNGDAWV